MVVEEHGMTEKDLVLEFNTYRYLKKVGYQAIVRGQPVFLF